MTTGGRASASPDRTTPPFRIRARCGFIPRVKLATPLLQPAPGSRNPKRPASQRVVIALAVIALVLLAWYFHKPILAWFSPPALPSPPPPKSTNAVVPAVVRTNFALPPQATNVVVRPVTNLPPSKGTNLAGAATNALASGRFSWPILEAQLALDRIGFSPGSMDGQFGPQTRAAVKAFQQREGVPPTGNLDPDTLARLQLAVPPLATYTVTTNDLARLQPLATTWVGKSQQSALDYETILELIAEKSHAHPLLIRRLNPDLNWTNIASGTTVQLLNVGAPPSRGKAAWVTIHLAGKTLQVFDSATNLLAHFPCSIAQRVEKRPVGELHVVAAAANPNYTFDPEVFPESAEARQLKTKLILPPGPNNPVGVAWVSLDRPGYGIHGTPKPEDVGRTESHGCFRLANWNAELLLKLVALGTPVLVVE